MIKVYLEGHEYRYDVYQLLKLFYFDEEILFIKEKALDNNQGLLIESYLKNENDNYIVNTNIYINGIYISSSNIDNINKIDIKEDNLKKKKKIAIKKSIFDAISKICKKDVPWGILTGVRPTKIVHELMDKGIVEETILEVLMKQYKISRDKANLIINIANNQRQFIYPIDEKNFSLYISIPFCPSRCIYCSFPAYSLRKKSDLVNKYIEKLLFELEKVAEFTKDMKLQTVYIGGGTPTSIPSRDLQRIIEKVNNIYDQKKIKEFTVEAGRPDTINKEMLLMLKENGIDRISINPQTMNDTTLKGIGRRHTTEDIRQTYELARKIGFKKINMDIIIGLPEEGEKEINKTMNQILQLSPDNLTVHTLALKKASKLRNERNNFTLQDAKTIRNMLNITMDYAKEMDMYPYYMYRQKQILGNFENIGYTKKDKECIYNMLIMEEKQTIIALGAGGVTKMVYPAENRIERVPNVKDPNEYINRVEEMIERKRKYLR
ncbi:coproporphyrinogen dehydrogenase HemZ [Thermohalobacter berrensis]|uniref:Coproporphyrinogen dehydrogenase HemZ n=1 Tax=Thermohalobacter berrensis TaxID=99594 RepID=A0A419TAX8_9FIRM|nr:coproporphyrinogen dehydrogenase HemZ [Thermohalobacter berrensis]RKD34644.1 coproporphyrinogen dehydrogenase HemZ [Thermohalobacter berrensis]